MGRYRYNETGKWITYFFKQKLSKSIFMDLKPATNNKDIFNVEYLQQCKVKFEPPKQKRNIAQCANCQCYGHTRNYCHLKPRCEKCADSSDVRCGGNHPANYKACTVYKDLQQKTFPPLRPKMYTPLPHLKQTLHTQSGVTYSQITKHNSSAPPPPLLMMNPKSTLHFHTIIPNSSLYNKVMTFTRSK
jgi:hypothetical protein